LAESEGRTGSDNHLIHEQNPYLLQQAENAVTGIPGGRRLSKGRREGRPISLSIGYATCYRGHVVAYDPLKAGKWLSFYEGYIYKTPLTDLAAIQVALG
jgi:hypothetical protein